VQWNENGKTTEEWLSRNRVVYRFGDAGLSAIKEFNMESSAPILAASRTEGGFLTGSSYLNLVSPCSDQTNRKRL
jgi:hypothetical protein